MPRRQKAEDTGAAEIGFFFRGTGLQTGEGYTGLETVATDKTRPSLREIKSRQRDGRKREHPRRHHPRDGEPLPPACLRDCVGQRRGLALGYVNNYLIPNTFNSLPSKLGLHFQLTQIEFGIYGFMLVLVMVLRPQGLFPERKRKLEITGEIVAQDAQAVVDDPTAGAP